MLFRSQPPGSRVRDRANVLSLPLYTLKFSLTRNESEETTAIASARSGNPVGKKNQRSIFPSHDEFSILEIVTSMYVHEFIMEAISNGNENDVFTHMTLKEVETTIAAINLKPTGTDKTTPDELEVAFSTILIFQDPFTVALDNALSDTVQSAFYAGEVKNYMALLKSAALLMNKNDIKEEDIHDCLSGKLLNNREGCV